MTSKVLEFQEIVDLALTLSPIDKVRLVERVVSTLEHDLTATPPTVRRSLYGLWTNTDIEHDDIETARQAMWNTFPRENV